MKLKGIKVGDKVSKYPIIQGGMGIGVSMHSLAGNVAKHGGIGLFSAANPGYKDIDFEKNPLKANLKAVGAEVKKAREIANGGILGANIMCAMHNYDELVKEFVANGIDLIVSGAGLPKNLPELVEGSNTKIAPIVSSARGFKLIAKMWIDKYNYVPDMVIIEGPEAGGHLGFKKEELEEYKNLSKTEIIEKVLLETLEAVKELEKTHNKEIPVIVAGGIFDGKDIARVMKLGAAGVQMATRFVVTEECDAHINMKMAYVNAKKEDVKIIKSPVGMPGRALNNKFIQKMETEGDKIDRCYRCIKSCKFPDTPYCITKALINTVTGNVDEGLIFCGSNVEKIDKITTVKELIDELVTEAESC